MITLFCIHSDRSKHISRSIAGVCGVHILRFSGKIRLQRKRIIFDTHFEFLMLIILTGWHESGHNDGHVPVGSADRVSSGGASHGSREGRRLGLRVGSRSPHRPATLLRVNPPLYTIIT